MRRFLQGLWWTVKLLALFVWTMVQVIVVICGVVLVIVGVLTHFVSGPRA